MEQSRHLELAATIAREHAFLRLPDDYRMWIEGLMHRATHVLNAYLHRKGITAAADDLIHIGMPRDIAPPDQLTADLMHQLSACELQRALHVRGPGAGGAEVIEELQDLLAHTDRMTAELHNGGR